VVGPDGKIRLRNSVLKPYSGDLFGTFVDNSGGMLYLSRIHYGTSPSKKFIMGPSDHVRARSSVTTEDSRKGRDSQAVQVWRDPHSIERKRRFAVSLSTLASKPEKRKVRACA
jgi:hypothetical protein